MPFYTFNVFGASGAPTLDVKAFPDDGSAFEYAERVLARHPLCDHVDIWSGDRRVAARHRDQPVLRPIAGPQRVTDNLLRYPRSRLTISGLVRPFQNRTFPVSEDPQPGKQPEADGLEGHSVTRRDSSTDQQPDG